LAAAPGTRCDSNRYPYSDSYGYSNGDTYGKSNSDSYGKSNTYCQRHGIAECNTYRYRDTHRNSRSIAQPVYACPGLDR
jgi:hypothetical protein